ncbi:MAG TPA: hypothetical protein VGO56_03450 [Pyrinomonadaceae bacterium]|jgi:hypothetical protein|nr:hypothetical protein [Pyrinomonadaceae bacterium]
MEFPKEKRLMSLKLVVCGAVAVASLAFVLAERSRAQMPRQHVITLKAGDDLQAALRAARFGDTIVLPAGSTFVGPIVLPFKSGGTGTDADFITIRTSDLNSISADGERLKPSSQARAMPKIVATTAKPAIATEQRAHHYKFIGVEFVPASNASYVYNVIELGSADYTSASQFPHHLIFDRCFVHSPGLNRARRGFALNSAETSIINSYVSGFAGAGDETQAIAGWNGPGPFHIVNNYLEGGGEVILIGGADPAVPNLVPSDIEIRRNYMRKPREWNGRALIKGTFEIKNARRVVIDGNLIESEILTTAIVLTPRNQGGKAPWSTIEDVEVTNNIVRHANTGINILGTDNEHRSLEARRIRIVNNLLVDIVADKPDNIPYFLQTNGGRQITVAHNTVQQAGNIITAYGAPTGSFIFRDNIVQFNQYGIVCLTAGFECARDNIFCNCFPGGVFKGNVIADNLGAARNDQVEEKYPTGNYFVSSFQRIGFSDIARGDWQLGANSKTRKRASDGGDPGVNAEALILAGATVAREGSKVARR